MMEKIQEDLGADFLNICLELLNHGIVFEGQFSNPDSMYCKKNSIEMVMAFSKMTNLNILFGYDTCYFVYYDTRRFTREEATEELRKYHNLT